ncbi:MAG TPA: ribonuclease III [Mycobacteriales bacterium]|nr:ribonuclease III [Mycobacteriales bacterium]
MTATVPPDSDRSVRDALLAVLGVDLEDGLLTQALTHRSFAYENGGLPTNERLEFLGDAVLGLVVTDTLFRAHPDLPEGTLAKLRASVVNARALADVARGIELGTYIRLGRGEEGTGGREKPSILADAMEALLGAVYLQHGFATAGVCVRRLFDPLIEASASRGAALDWKTSLQELASSRSLGPPDYEVSETGPDHAKRFTAHVVVGGTRYGAGEGGTKKEAELIAAEHAYNALTAPPPDAD